MKKKILSFVLALSIVAIGLTGCGKSSAEDKKIVVGAGVTPHSEILNNVVKGILEKEGYELEVVEYNDYVLPNKALDSGEIDANYFQHQPYLDDFNAENKTEIVSVAKVHFEPFGIYPGKTASLSDLKDGAEVAVPNDTTNEARALLLLESQGLIKLNPDAGLQATALDVVENPLNLKITEMEAAQLARVLEDIDIACINGNYAMEGGFSVSDALAVESADSKAAQTYANIIAVKAGNEENEKIKALVEAINSDEVKKYIEDNYDGAVVPVF